MEQANRPYPAARPQANPFLVGPPLPPENIIGYERMRGLLRSWAYGPCCGISLHGMHRTGKTSLAIELCSILRADAQANILAVYVNLAEILPEEGQSWFSVLLRCILCDALADEAEERLTPEQFAVFEAAMQEFMACPPDGNRFRSRFKRAFMALERMGFKTCLILDEFDRAAQEGGFSSKADFELFRTLSGRECGVGLMLISRRELYLIEKDNPGNSVFNGAFSKYSLPGFQESDGRDGSEPHSDMTAYYKVLAAHGIELTGDEKEELWYFTGWNPYLLSAFGFELVEAAARGRPRPTMHQIYRQRLQTVRDYMDTVYSRLDGDARLKGENSYAQKLVGIVIGPMIGITENDVELFEALGYLRRVHRSEHEYQCVSGAFTHYLANKRVSSEAWTELMELDSALRAVIRREFEPGPERLTQDQWFTVLADAFLKADQQPDFRPGTYLRDIRVNEDAYHETLEVPDVMSMKDCFRIVRAYWYENFCRYFDEQDLGKWEPIFESCGAARNPYAHNTARKLMTAEQQAQVRGYCAEITLQLREKAGGCTPMGVPSVLRQKFPA